MKVFKFIKDLLTAVSIISYLIFILIMILRFSRTSFKFPDNIQGLQNFLMVGVAFAIGVLASRFFVQKRYTEFVILHTLLIVGTFLATDSGNYTISVFLICLFVSGLSLGLSLDLPLKLNKIKTTKN